MVSLLPLALTLLPLALALALLPLGFALTHGPALALAPALQMQVSPPAQALRRSCS